MVFREEKAETHSISAADRPHMLGLEPQPEQQSEQVTALDSWLARKMLKQIGRPPVAIVLWNKEIVSLGPEIHCRVIIRDRNALYQLLFDPEARFGDLYSTRRVEVEGELVDLLEDVYRGLQRAEQDKSIRHSLVRWFNRPRSNNLDTSQDNIHHHYDIGNRFYEYWLDREAMQYTCGYFPQPNLSLEQAQVAKLHHVCRKLQLKPGDRVVEAGCGWGGLARFMAKHYGVTVRAYNISHQQLVYARARALQEGLAEQVKFIEDDYRNIHGEYDVFVSVGMLEHVGPEHYKTLGGVIDQVLTDDGRGLVHSIGRNKPGLMNAWIEKRIFPGAYPPSLREMMDIFEPYGLAIQDVENLRLHYAKTLQHWLARFENHTDAIREEYDDLFVRAWRLYLAGSIAAFTTSQLQLFQVLFTRPYSNNLPWSRAHLYSADNQS